MGAKRARGGTAWDGLHHWRLDLEEVKRIEEVAQVADDAGTRAKHLAALLAHDQIDITPAVARLGVGKSVPLVRQRPQRLHQQLKRLDPHRQLSGLGAKQQPARADDVAHVPALEGLVGRSQAFGLQVELDLPGAVGNLGEARLAHDALEHQAPANRDTCRVGAQPLLAALAEGIVQLSGEHIAPELVGKGIAALAQFRKLAAPLGDQLVFLALGISAPALFRVAHFYTPAFSEASMN